jgi:glycosyltransferase involved in cell wall biosynthesis
VAKVSVVIPTHNRQERLANAIRSVLEQTEKDFEVFVVDDGSADEAAAEVVRACRDARVSYIRLPVSRGPAAARNAGIARATAPYVAFLDDDDEWLPEKLEVQLAVLEQSEPSTGVVHTARITVDKIAGTSVTTRSPARFDPARGRSVITLSSVLMRRVCFERVGLFDEELFGNEDFDLWIRVGEVFEFQYVDQPLLKYFIYEDGISHHEGRKALSDVLDRKVHSLERLLAKHRRVFEADRRGHCLSYLMLADRYRRVDDVRNERRALRHAMRRWPLEPRIYWALMRSLLSRRGTANFVAGSSA